MTLLVSNNDNVVEDDILLTWKELVAPNIC